MRGISRSGKLFCSLHPCRLQTVGPAGSHQRQEGSKEETRIHPFDKILSNTPAARNAIKCQLSVPGLTTHTYTASLPLSSPLPRLKTPVEGRAAEDQGSSRSQGSEAAFSLNGIHAEYNGGHRENGAAGGLFFSSHSSFCTMGHDNMTVGCVALFPRVKQSLIPLWKQGCSPLVALDLLSSNRALFQRAAFVKIHNVLTFF